MKDGWAAPTATSYPSPDLWSNQWNMAGLAYDGTYIQAFDRKVDARLSIFVYDTFDNMLLGYKAPASSWVNYQVPETLWSPEWTMTGIAYDGSKYIQVFDNNTTAALSIWTYDSLADLLLGYKSSSYKHYGVDKLLWDPKSLHEWTTAGIAYDGTQYILGFDNNTTAALSILTFDKFGDLLLGPSAKSGYIEVKASVWEPTKPGPDWNMVGLAYEPVPEPATMLLLGTGLVGVAGAARRRKKNQA